MGGTFDPVHTGHLACALSAKDHLELEQIKLIPCAITPHRDQPGRSPQQRSEMLQLACKELEGFSVDTRELEREGPSYTVDTLESLREELGKNSPIIFILGTDAFENILSWHKAQEILNLAHLLVLQRPGYQLPQDGPLKDYIGTHQCKESTELKQSPCGKLHFMTGPLVDISASELRECFDFSMGGNVAQKIQTISQYLPESVKDYIHQNGLYQERC